jgi:hypothetical protein
MVAAASGEREPAKVVAVEIRIEWRGFMSVAGERTDFQAPACRSRHFQVFANSRFFFSKLRRMLPSPELGGG